MRVLTDTQQQLNYNPLVVYFMLRPEEFQRYQKHIANLNKYNVFTRGIFKFRAIARGDQYSSELSEELTRTIRRFNVILRLVNDCEGSFNYALGKMDFNQDPDIFESGLQRFIIDACKYNLKLLKSQLQYDIDNSDQDPERSSMISGIAQSFKSAIELRGFRRGVWRKLVSPEPDVLIMPNHCTGEMLASSVNPNELPEYLQKKKHAFANKLSDRNLKEEFDRLMDLFVEQMGAPSKRESDKYAEGTVNHSKSKDLIVDYKSRVRPVDSSPSITIAIAKVPAAHKRTAWGIEVNINGETVPIHISSTEGIVLYVSTLLMQKSGLELNRNIFKRSVSGRECERHRDVVWLRRVCKAVRPALSDFDEWYLRMRDGVDAKTPMKLHGINQAKNLANADIKRHLQKEHIDAIYYCKLQPDGQNIRGTYYVNTPSDNIIIPKEFENCLLNLD